ncbi:hypothetical protein ATANTOWER_021312 [Ataeniobius toweri]|uniref:Uncharacterized protein n=1 Tax=Ataeniobius toweri TaxID=208326 RepID=A0ABU7BC14_9TELE|nr:hypothetical protein [Ataeniobius toweri]
MMQSTWDYASSSPISSLVLIFPPCRTSTGSTVGKRAANISADLTHPTYNLLELLPAGRRYRALFAKRNPAMELPYRHAHALAPQPRMDDFTALPGFPL